LYFCIGEGGGQPKKIDRAGGAAYITRFCGKMSRIKRKSFVVYRKDKKQNRYNMPLSRM
jgi:hypothetical protein